MAKPIAKQDAEISWSRIKEIFQASLGLSGEERRRLIERESQGDEGIKKEVMDLLAAHERTDGLEHGPASPVLSLLKQSISHPIKVGPYCLLEPIGAGGMAEIYLAKTSGASGFEKMVAAKRILPMYTSDPISRKLFEYEAKICSVLDHPNIVHVHDFVRTDDTYVLIMEYVWGKTLAQVCNRLMAHGQPLPLELALYIVSEILKGLDYAHTKQDPQTGTPLGIIHRDVSPNNVMVSYEGLVKLLDFGIAKTKDRTTITQTGTLQGTLHYFAPEYLRTGKASPLTDLFSVGVILYELISGETFFDARDVNKILELVESYETPNARVAELSVPEEVKQMLRRSLAVDPAERFPDAGTFQYQLQDFLNSRFPPHQVKRLSEVVKRCFCDEHRLEQARMASLRKRAETLG